MKQAHVLIDLQYGSTGKGSLAALLGHYLRPDCALAAWGPNAGHTSYDMTGNKYIHTMVPNSTTMGVPIALIGPGAAINVHSLRQELQDPVLKGLALVIHPGATIVREDHRDAERGLIRVGSTMKGTGAALIEKINRDPSTNPLAGAFFNSADLIDMANGSKLVKEFDGRTGPCVMCSEREYRAAMDMCTIGLVEGAQGFSLGYHTQFWPHVTSRDVSPYQMLADCRVPVMAGRPMVWATCRTYPIRVANRFNKAGAQIGSSGPCYPDQLEITWAFIGQEPELTTVTRLPRRLFTWSQKQIGEAARVARPDVVMLTFCDYVSPKPVPGARITGELYRYVQSINLACDGRNVTKLLAFGPRPCDILEYDSSTGRLEILTMGTFARMVAEAGATQ